jgi:hypothetical protein
MLTSNEQFVVKLPAERVDALAMAGRGAHFEPSHGRPMSQWFVAGAALEESWLLLAEESLSFVAGQANLLMNETEDAVLHSAPCDVLAVRVAR